MSSSTLWIVATPLGNPGDLSPRARRVLESADAVLAEDTRRTGRLLSECGIPAPPLISLHDHNEEERVSGVLDMLREGRQAALVSDAGTPLLSDPGYRLVRACREAGLRVSPVPGPSAPLAALCACGLPPYPFAFLGFAPRAGGAREAFFAPYARLPLTLAFFERKDRLAGTLADAHAVLGEREGCIARELTKTHEEFLFFSLSAHAGVPTDLKGEITVIIGPPKERTRTDEMETARIIDEEWRGGGGAREVARRARERLSGWNGKEVYREVLARRPATEEAPGNSPAGVPGGCP